MSTRCVFGMVVRITLWLCPLLAAASTMGQNVTTQHNDIGRTGSNTTETVLAPSNVNTSSFGKVFYYVVDGYVYAQPLYISNVTLGSGTAQAGTKHNVVYIATEHDGVYAFDADGNLGANGNPLWRVTLLDAAHGAAVGATTIAPRDTGETDLVPEIGITGTPVIDPSTNTLYVVSMTTENNVDLSRLHALDPLMPSDLDAGVGVVGPLLAFQAPGVRCVGKLTSVAGVARASNSLAIHKSSMLQSGCGKRSMIRNRCIQAR